MSLRLLVDMNLSPEWIAFLSAEGIPSVHWSDIGDPKADDSELMAWAAANSHAVFTHDLDFGTALALTGAVGPSVIQIRSAAVLPEQIGQAVVAAVRQFASELIGGALLVIEPNRNRIRILPLNSPGSP